MTRISKWTGRLFGGAGAALLFSSTAIAETKPVLNVYSTGVAQNAARVLQLDYAKAVRQGWENGPNFAQTGGTDARVVNLLKEGAEADVVIVQTSEMAGLEAAGLVVPGTVTPLGLVLIAVGVRAGTPHPDISNYEKFRDALLAAGTVAYTDPASGSAGGRLIHSVLDKPEFANLKRVHGVSVANGNAPIWLEAAGQLRGASGVEEVGLLPESLRAHLQFSIAVGANAKYPKEAAAFQNYVLQPQFAPVWTRWGVTR